MLPVMSVRDWQTSEMIKAVGEWLASQRHRETDGISEVRQGLTSRRMVLAEDQVTVRSLSGSAMGNPALKRLVKAAWVEAQTRLAAPAAKGVRT